MMFPTTTTHSTRSAGLLAVLSGVLLVVVVVVGTGVSRRREACPQVFLNHTDSTSPRRYAGGGFSFSPPAKAGARPARRRHMLQPTRIRPAESAAAHAAIHEQTGAECIVRALEEKGVRTVFGIPGGANLPLYEALGKSERLRHILVRHEQAAGFMAQGAARLTGKPSVCIATSGPGATNLLTALADAYADGVPVVAITGQVPRALLGTQAFQEADIAAMSRPAVKAAWRAHSVEELSDLLDQAFELAASPRPGPVLIDVPKDVQLEKTAYIPQCAGKMAPQDTCGHALDMDSVTNAATLLAGAARPVILLGAGAVHARAGDIATRMAKALDASMTATLQGLGAVPHDHPAFLGMCGMHGTPAANTAVAECDVLLIVGARLGDRTTGRLERFCPKARIVRIDADPSARRQDEDIFLGGDAGDVLATLLPSLEKLERRRKPGNACASGRPESVRCGDCGDGPRTVIRMAGEVMGPDAIIVTDVGQHQMWTAQAYPFARAGRWLTSGGLGTMGFGLPTALGAAVTCPDDRVLLVTGDGSLLMNLQELATLRESGADIAILLMDNGGLGLVRQQQDLFHGGRDGSSRFCAGTDFAAVARGFGIPSWDLEFCEDGPEALKDALAMRGPRLIRVPVDEHAAVWPMVPPGAANTCMLKGKAASSLQGAGLLQPAAFEKAEKQSGGECKHGDDEPWAHTQGRGDGDFAQVSPCEHRGLERGIGLGIDRRAQNHAGHGPDSVQSAFAQGCCGSAGAVAHQSPAQAKDKPADDVGANDGGFEGQGDYIRRDQRVYAHCGDHDGGEHELNDGHVLEPQRQELLVVAGHAGSLQEHAKEDAGDQSYEKRHGYFPLYTMRAMTRPPMKKHTRAMYPETASCSPPDRPCPDGQPPASRAPNRAMAPPMNATMPRLIGLGPNRSRQVEGVPVSWKPPPILDAAKEPITMPSTNIHCHSITGFFCWKYSSEAVCSGAIACSIIPAVRTKLVDAPKYLPATRTETTMSSPVSAPPRQGLIGFQAFMEAGSFVALNRAAPLAKRGPPNSL
eukprot:TRINITY_DN1622_c0_g3_i1.p1 TRINITY_DN1622_c0_g3~~TRINITY_DN1622_c0_g3_i1.p1  ORF type:complete len:1033 (-),score=206.89 TRINITY_DN1622_c0_g3_i1:2650-5748(-)